LGIRIKKQAETWENRFAIAYSNSQRPISIELNDILSNRKWKILETTSSKEAAFTSAAIGKAAMLILDDTEQDPAAIMQREQLFHQVACITPTLIICSQHNETDFKCMASMGEPVMVRKPFSPKTMIEGVDQLCGKWSQGYLFDVRRAAAKMAEGQVQTGFRILTEIVQSGQKAPIAAAALALYYRRQDDIRMAEKLLVSAIKQGLFEMSIILPLIDLYLYAGSPKLALRLVEMAFERFNKPNFLCIDAVQALLMLNRVEECIPYLQQLIEKDYFPEVARQYLPRLYYSSGQVEQFDKAIKYSAEKFDDYQRAWHLLADEQAARGKQQFEQPAQLRKQTALQEKKDKAVTEPLSSINRNRKSQKALDFGPVGKPLFQGDRKTPVDG
jgi:tetratricopeptide (TPR) repeat protein